ncbi:MAG: hypothetical protein JWO42_3958 [Chloroflexi bacterium]|nr:hypothetical protein [Chloroflexota bacterium]
MSHMPPMNAASEADPKEALSPRNFPPNLAESHRPETQMTQMGQMTQIRGGDDGSLCQAAGASDVALHRYTRTAPPAQATIHQVNGQCNLDVSGLNHDPSLRAGYPLGGNCETQRPEERDFQITLAIHLAGLNNVSRKLPSKLATALLKGSAAPEHLVDFL